MKHQTPKLILNLTETIKGLINALHQEHRSAMVPDLSLDF